MVGISTSGILLRRVEYGDYDYILTFLTVDTGKVTLIAKNAKKSVKRFFGILELFSLLDLTYVKKNTNRMSVLQEASLDCPFEGIRSDMMKTAYASYWAEIIYLWLEEHVAQEELFQLLKYVLDTLDQGNISPNQLSLLFQIRFVDFYGFMPHFRSCSHCHIDLEALPQFRVGFDLAKGTIVCDKCAKDTRHLRFLSKGTIKQLIWLQRGELQMTKRLRIPLPAILEGLDFLEAFVPYHIGRTPKSLGVLRHIRKESL